MYLELIVLSLVSMSAPVMAKLAGYEMGRKPFDLCAVAGIFFLLSAACGLGVSLIPMMTTLGTVVSAITVLLGWVSLAIGALWGALNVIREPDHSMIRQHV